MENSTFTEAVAGENREPSAWKPVPGGLKTRWAGDVDPENVLPEYPRPQMVRASWKNLNGLWDYAIRPHPSSLSSDKEESIIPADELDKIAYNGRILVPFPIESALSGIKRLLLPKENLWYKRTFSIPSEWKGQKLLLHFGAVDWKAEVWVNRHRVGEHTGGYYPFSFEISQYLAEGENEIIVAVWDPTDTGGQEHGKQVLRPGGIFYTAVSGIWQTVWLEPVPKNYIESVKLTPDIDSGELSIGVKTVDEVSLSAENRNASFEIEAAAYENNIEIASLKSPAKGSLKLPIRSPNLWSPDTPFLYDLKIRLLSNGKIIDEISSYFGMRKFTAEADQQGIMRLFLNNKPLFQNGVLDQGYWPDGLYTAPTDEALEYDVKMTKKFGFNMTRKHIKVEPARWYHHCDRLGLIVWQDMINGGAAFSALNNLLVPTIASRFRIRDNKYKRFGRNEKENRENYKKELKEMIDALYNVPSIGMWIPFNEAWGQFDAAETAAWLREYDPTRCIDHASGWNDQGAGDVKSLHIYFTRLKMPWKTGGRTVAITEYGGYSMKVPEHVLREDREFGYRKFTSKEYLQTAYKYLIRSQVKPLIRQGLSAVVYTQLTDVETEINGLMTYDRAVEKIDSELVNELAKELV